MTSPSDPWSATHHLEESLLDALAARLEARGRHPLFVRMLTDYLDAMAVDEAGTVLDLGCGTGLVARTIARRSKFVGTILAVDQSSYLLKAGARFAEEEQLGDRIRFEVGDAGELDVRQDSVDAVVLHTLLSHVADPMAVLAEVARVCAPGGMVAVFDADFASLTFGYADAGLAKTYDDALMRSVASSPRVMREMPRLLRSVGLECVEMFSNVLAEVGAADYWLSAIETYQRLLVVTGTMTADEAAGWADGLLSDSANGVFFGSSNFYTYLARRP